MNIKGQLKALNTLGLVLLLGSTIISPVLIWLVKIILHLIISFISIFDVLGIFNDVYVYRFQIMNSSAYMFLNISLILLGLILIIKDLKTDSK
ncbi:MAG: hypothetical protein ACRCST_05105 [Turicibacter sp.]